MASEVVAKIMGVAHDEEEDAYVVQFWVGKELDEGTSVAEALQALSHLDGLRRQIYTFLVRWEDEEFSMEPDDDLAECLQVYDEHEDAAGLEDPLHRQWKTGQMAEAMVSHLVNANVFGVWRTAEDIVEGPNLLLSTETVIEREPPEHESLEVTSPGGRKPHDA